MGRDSLVLKLRAARVEVATVRHFWPDLPGREEYGEAVRELTAWYNEIYCRIVEDSAPHFRQPSRAGDAALEAIRAAAGEQHRWLDEQLDAARTRFLEATQDRWPDSSNRQTDTLTGGSTMASLANWWKPIPDPGDPPDIRHLVV